MNRLPALFDANGSFGCGVSEEPDFPRPEDFLAHMDRLGIARSLVWMRSAIPDCVAGNRRLLEFIGDCPQGGQRLIPSLVVAPKMGFRETAVRELSGLMSAGPVQALRAAPQSLCYRLPQLEPLLERVRSFRPVLMVDLKEVGDEQDIRHLAGRFPDIPIVCLQGMWGWMVRMAYLMDRCPNILIETSWVHDRGTVEFFAGRFGARRLVFGLGPRAHQGAAVAALAHADLPDSEKDAIAHRNLERLLGLKETNAQTADSRRQTRGTFRSRFLAGKRIGVEILDAHSHLGNSARWIVEEQSLEDEAAGAVGTMDRFGISSSVVFIGSDHLGYDPLEGNRLLERAAGEFPGRFLGMVSYNPHYEHLLMPALDGFFSRGFFVGFKILCDYWQVPVTDPRFETVWRYADEGRLPVLLHTWDGGYDSPRMLRDIAREHPDAVFILGHSGGGDTGRREAESLALECPNVYLEWCGSFCSRVPWGETIGRVGNTRVVFGTDAAYHNVAWEMGRLLSLNLPDDTLAPILGKNMRSILARRRLS